MNKFTKKWMSMLTDGIYEALNIGKLYGTAQCHIAVCAGIPELKNDAYYAMVQNVNAQVDIHNKMMHKYYGQAAPNLVLDKLVA